ncbi:MAG: hypothetical protein RL720_317, partial [Actinomycetota bacterium]
MVRNKLLLGVASAFIFVVSLDLIGTPIAYAASSCSSVDQRIGTCTGAQTSNNSVDVWARSTTPGGSSSAVVAPIGRTTGTRSTVVRPVFYPSSFAFRCLGFVTPSPQCQRKPITPTPSPAPVTYAPITVSDLANFVPQAATLTSQPRGWSVVNLNTNFIAGASVHVVGGALFGQSAEVQFTPRAYDWNYDDGATQSTAVPGARWDSLGLREF